MAEYMKKVAKDSETELSVEERNLLSVAYKNVIGARRAAWRILSSLESRADKNKETIVKYKENIEKELTKICNEILEVLKDVLIPSQLQKSPRFSSIKCKSHVCGDSSVEIKFGITGRVDGVTV